MEIRLEKTCLESKKYTNTLFSFTILIAIFGILSGCDSSDNRREANLDEVLSEEELDQFRIEDDENVFKFGFDLRRSLREDAKQYQPFLKYLEVKTGFEFGLYFTKKGGSIADNIGKGIVQFAAVGAGTYIKACEADSVIPLVRGVMSNGRSEYRAVIFTSIDSDIKTVKDIRGKRFAFGGFTSTQGHLIPRIILIQYGISLGDLQDHGWMGSHSETANSVTKGDYDAGGMQDLLGWELEKAGLIRIIHTSDFYPSSGIVANSEVSQEVISSVTSALLDFQPNGRDSTGLIEWDKTEMSNGFVKAEEGDYAELIDWARKFGLIGNTDEEQSK